MLRPLIVAILLVPLLANTVRADLPADRLQRLLDLLTDSDYRVRLQAAIALGQAKDVRAVPALIRRLKDSHALVRGMTAAALGALADTRGLGPLREHLRDRDSLVRKRAQFGIEQIQRAERAKKVASTSKPRPGSRTILVRLGGIGDRTKRGKVLIPELRRLWSERIQSTPGIRLLSGPPGAQKFYEVNTAITELSSQHRGNLVETTCSLSVVVGDNHGSIVMMTSGGATVQVHSRKFSKSQEPALRQSALANAVATAHSNVVKFFAAR